MIVNAVSKKAAETARKIAFLDLVRMRCTISVLYGFSKNRHKGIKTRLIQFCLLRTGDG